MHGGGKRRKLGHSNLHVIELPGNASETAVVERLRRNPHLKFAELDVVVRSSLAVTDPYIGSAWHLPKVGAAVAWDSTQGAGVTIAILDSGIDTSHPDLAGNLVAGYNIYGNNTDVSDICGHGTSVAGTAAARTNNGTGVAGVAGQAKIMPLKIAYLDPATNGCLAYASTIANGLTYAADHGARVANISYAVGAIASVQSAANYMKSKGGLVFASAGNNGAALTGLPTTSMIVVGATDGNDARTSWSNYGAIVELTAPGAGIWTTKKGGTYGAVNGTSFSSPLAAGVAALMMAAAPTLSNTQIQQLLVSTSADLGAVGRDALFGFGRVNAAAAVAAAEASVAAVDSTAPTAAIGAPLGSSSVSGLVPVSVTAADNVGVARVELQANGATVAVDTAAPFAFSWNSAGSANGMVNLVAVAFDAAGNRGQSATVAVNVANAVVQTVAAADSIAPAVAISNPVGGAVSGSVNVSVNATDNNGAAAITQTLSIDGVVVARATGGALAYSWNTRKASVGTHTIQAVARDAAGNTSISTVSATTR